MNWRAAVLCTILASCAACRRGASDPFPSPAETPGWSKTRTRTFQAADLWRYVDGDAERYLAAGIERTHTAGYRHNTGAEAVVDVHVMKDVAAARKIMASEAGAGSQPLEVGDEGRSYGPSITFRRHRCFVRLTLYEDSPALREDLVALARAVDQWLARLRP
ncbi:MAG: DUF6599 family protein [Bryobacteraceae bacterium]